MTKKDVSWLFAVIFLACALLICVILGVTGFFTSVVYLKSQTDLTVGDALTILVEPNGVSTMSLTFDGAYFPSEEIPQIVQISALTSDVDLKFRIKSVVTGSDKVFSFVTSDHFSLENDQYIYDDVLEHGTKVTFCTAIVTPSDADFVSGERYVLTIVVEAYEEALANQIWNV